MRKLHTELATSIGRRDELDQQRIKFKEKQGELELENRMLEEEMRRDNKEKEEITVQNDLLLLEVRRLKDLLSAKADAVFSLENRKQQLLLSMEERKQEIAVHRDVLKSEAKSLNEEKHKVVMELRGREAVVAKLKARFEAVAKQDEGHSQSYYIILAAQKKEELQRHGDELDHEIRKAEREIRALQTTLDHLNARNTAYRASFQKVDLQGEDAEVLQQLEERMKLGRDALFRKKKEQQRLVTDLEEDARRMDQLSAQQARVEKQKEHLFGAKAQVEEEILTQQSQLNDLDDKISKMAIRHRAKVSDLRGVDPSAFAGGTLEEKSARAEVLKDTVQVKQPPEAPPPCTRINTCAHLKTRHHHLLLLLSAISKTKNTTSFYYLLLRCAECVVHAWAAVERVPRGVRAAVHPTTGGGSAHAVQAPSQGHTGGGGGDPRRGQQVQSPGRSGSRRAREQRPRLGWRFHRTTAQLRVGLMIAIDCRGRLFVHTASLEFHRG